MGSPKTSPPGPEALIAGQNDGSFLVASGDELEEEIGSLAIDGDIADLIDDQQLRRGENSEFFLQAVLCISLTEGSDKGHRGQKQRAESLLASFKPQGCQAFEPAACESKNHFYIYRN